MSISSTTETVSTVSDSTGAATAPGTSASAPETPVTSKTGQARDALGKELGTVDPARATNPDPGAWTTTGTPVSVSAVQRDLSDAHMRTVTFMAVKEKEGPGYKFTVGLPDGRVNVYWVEDNPRFNRKAVHPGKYGTPAIQVTRNGNEYVRDVRVSIYESGTRATPSERRCRLTVLAELDEKDRQTHGGIWARTQRYSLSEKHMDLLFPPPDDPSIGDKLHPAGRESTAPRTTPPVPRTPASTPALPASATPVATGVPMVATPGASGSTPVA